MPTATQTKHRRVVVTDYDLGHSACLAGVPNDAYASVEWREGWLDAEAMYGFEEGKALEER